MADLTVDELLGILCRTDISPSARIGWQYLLAEQRAGRPWPSLARLGVALGVTERWAREIIRELIAAGEIHKPEYGQARFPAVDGGKPIRIDEEEKIPAAVTA